MPITPKPFSENDKLQKRVFGARPNIFSVEDFNQYIDIVDNHLVRLSRNVGMIRYNWKVNLLLSRESVSGANNQYDTQINLLKEDNDLPAYVYYRGIRFEIPVGTAIQYSGTFQKAKPELPVGYLVLIAKKTVVTFAQNAAMGGVTASEYPNALPSSDAVQWGGERMVYVSTTKSGIALAAGEEIVGIIASVVPSDDGKVSVTRTTPTGSTQVQIETKYTAGTTRKVLYHAVLAGELLDFLTFTQGDEVLRELNLTTETLTEQAIENNGHLNEAVVFLREYLQRKLTYMKLGFRAVQGKLDATGQTLLNMQQLLDDLNKTVEELRKLTEVPLGGCILYHGSLAEFDNTGKGTGKMKAWAVCNGLNGTPDLRGRFPVMAIAGIPAVGAGALAKEVDPTNPDVPAGSNPNHSPGQKGGEAAHKLEISELPDLKDALQVKGYRKGVDHSSGVQDTTLANDSTSSAAQAVPGSIATSGMNGSAHNNLPPFFVTVFIQRTA